MTKTIDGGYQPEELEEDVDYTKIVVPKTQSTVIMTGKTKLKNVDHPDHYNSGSIEVIDAIEDWDLGFHLGNVVKYIARAKHKGKEKEDLEKALWYLTRYLEKLDAKKA